MFFRRSQNQREVIFLKGIEEVRESKKLKKLS
jgi:hypothetical protein